MITPFDCGPIILWLKSQQSRNTKENSHCVITCIKAGKNVVLAGNLFHGSSYFELCASRAAILNIN
jgi:hypothetical protein